MKIKLIKKHKLVKKELKAGTVIDVTNEKGKYLIDKGLAEYVNLSDGLSEKIVKKSIKLGKNKVNLNNNNDQVEKPDTKTQK